LFIRDSVGIANPRDAGVSDRRRWSTTDLNELSLSRALLLLCPPPGAITRGAWVELGAAYMLGILIVSSGDTKQSIFTGLGFEFETDAEAIDFLFGSTLAIVGAP
jgi:hypothetical protein